MSPTFPATSAGEHLKRLEGTQAPAGEASDLVEDNARDVPVGIQLGLAADAEDVPD